MRTRLFALLALALVAALGVPALALAADPAPHAYAAAIDYAAGTLRVAAHYDPGTAAVLLYDADGTTLIAHASCSSTRSKVLFPSFALRSRRTFVVRGYGADGAWRWSRSITLDPVDYRPLKPTLTVYNGTVVGPRLSLAGDAHRPALQARAYVLETDRSYIAEVPPVEQGGFTFSGVAMPFGENHVTVWASNGFGSGPKAAVRVYNLGTDLPAVKRYVFLSKRILWMFDIRYGRVIHRWPIAIGTPQTPTPSGTFFIGRRMAAPNGAWGPFRRPLLRRHDGSYTRTRYYIHGTNEPWSIGMAASHGCVRMYNRDLREFERVVPDYTRVRIR